jgi:thiol-disulfide isomerase/thioredoxin
MKKLLFLFAVATLAFACDQVPENEGGGDGNEGGETADLYTITVIGGKASVEGTEAPEAKEGATVTLTHDEPAEGFEFVEWTSNDVVIEGNSFTMPARNVTAKAELKEIEPVTDIVSLGDVTVDFGNASDLVWWAEAPYFHKTELTAKGIITIPTHNGYVELSFINNDQTESKFLLRGGDEVRVSHNNGGTQISSLTDPAFNSVYNFPASVGTPPVSPDILAFDKYRTQRGMPSIFTANPDLLAKFNSYREQFMVNLAKINMPEKYKDYYTNGYFAPESAVYNDELVPYFSNRYWLTVKCEAEILKLGSGVTNSTKMKNLFNTIANNNSIPPTSKMILLRELLDIGFTILTDTKVYEEYLDKYVALTGDDLARPNPLRFETDEVHLEDPNGNPETLSAILERYKGKLVYVDFWASWCGPCNEAMPIAAQRRKQYPNVAFIYISLDTEIKKSWIPTQSSLGLPESYVIINMAASKFMNQLKVTSIPRYILFDRTGNLYSSRAPGPSSIGTLFDKLGEK